MIKHYFLISSKSNYNFFWHENDKFTITSHGFIWTHFNTNKEYLRKNLYVNKKTILTLPELIDKEFNYNINPNYYYSICSDQIDQYRKRLSKNS